MITLIANAQTKEMVTRKSVSYDEAKSMFQNIDEKIAWLSNCNNGFSIKNESDGIDVLVKDWVAYKHSDFNPEHVDFTYYWFHY